uniref:Homoserine O-succinyltransferase n=1 Tax=Herpetomonas muscarum TaxID=5718 RepID=U5KL70_HERMU|nr:homoserine O-succinyltransferase [Herpetomonas muscarum]
MPINVPEGLPAIEALVKEHIFILEESRATAQDIRPIQVAVLNLMPLKIATETDLIRPLSNSPLQVDITLVRLDSHIPKTTPYEHLLEFYTSFSEIEEKKRKFDGFIVTGAPIEEMPFEEVRYWAELQKIMTWAETNVTSTLYICWAAQAALYHKYGVPKHPLKEKTFGVFEINNCQPGNPLLRGFDDVFYAPHSRHTEVRKGDLERLIPAGEVEILCEGDDVGVHLLVGRKGRDVYVTGHAEYAPYTLDAEYQRDVKKGRDIQVPVNYYRNNNPDDGIVVRWRGHGNLMYTNWLNHLVYQNTPYNINDVK